MTEKKHVTLRLDATQPSNRKRTQSNHPLYFLSILKKQKFKQFYTKQINYLLIEYKHLYGESYWHREHQVPYMSICRKHKCRLNEYDNKSKREFVGSPILPEFIDSGSAPEHFMYHYEMPLAKTLHGYLTQPSEVGPTEGYSNLYYTLECKYKTSIDKRTVSLNTNAIYRNLWDYYGEKITRAFYGKTMPKYFPMKLRNWEFTSPERYVLLAVLIGQDAEITFGKSQRHSFDKELIRLRERRFPMIRKRAANG